MISSREDFLPACPRGPHAANQLISIYGPVHKRGSEFFSTPRFSLLSNSHNDSLNRHDLFGLLLHQLINVFDVLIGHLLQLISQLFDLILGYVLL